MNENAIVFSFNDTEKIILSLEKSLEYLDSCDWADIILVQKDQHILLSNDSIYYNINRFNDFLQKVLLNKLPLDTSDINNSGYLWESYSSGKSCMTWLYNDKNGTIIFEVTPEESHFIKKIATETAQEWLQQTHYIIQKIENNIERWEKII